jgi:TadE-like protein
MLARRFRTSSSGQALIEFALVFPVILTALFFMLTGLFFVTQDSSVLSAAQVGSRIAAGASPGGPSGANALDQVQKRLPALLEPGLPGTHIRYVVSADPSRCPPTSETSAPGSLIVCSSYATGPASGTQLIVVRIYGRLPAIFPGMPAFPIDEQAAVHSLAFAR